MKNRSNRYLITEIKNEDFFKKKVKRNIFDYHIRLSSRGVLIHKDKIALLNVTKYNYHKLPGGGIEKGEESKDGFLREILEETGCKSSILDKGSIIMEFRDNFKLLQISYIYLAEVKGIPGKPHFEKSEIEEGFKLNWVSFNNAISILKNDNPINYEGKFIQKRDMAIINFYKDTILK